MGSYIRLRRLAKASQDLLDTEESILSIALRYRFESQEAFARAFKTIYHVTPSLYRQRKIRTFVGNKQSLDYQRLTRRNQQITLQPEIHIFPDRHIAGMRTTFSLQENHLEQDWELFHQMVTALPYHKEDFFGICEYSDSTRMERIGEETLSSEFIGFQIESPKHLPQGFAYKLLPGGMYAVFTHTGSLLNLRDSYDYIWNTWLFQCDYEIDERDDYEHYDETFTSMEDAYSLMRICIPIRQDKI